MGIAAAFADKARARDKNADKERDVAGFRNGGSDWPKSQESGTAQPRRERSLNA